MEVEFSTDHKSILAKMDRVDPLLYGKTRNYINGAVTCLSPYISRGVISTKMLLENVLQRGYTMQQMESFIKELCWRDYFQRVAQVKDVDQEIKQVQQEIVHRKMPVQVIRAATGIEGIDTSIRQLYKTGYMHNHCRMYTASIVCNIAKAHWYQPAQWMYYHLLDGDWASNACSWQWVAGANSNKKYFANQENINKYTVTNQSGTFLDHAYEVIENMEIPQLLLETAAFQPVTDLPDKSEIQISRSIPTFIYNYYNLDPLWHPFESGNRVLLIDPDFFACYPVSKNCMDFMLALAHNIEGIQVYVGSFASLVSEYQLSNVYFKEHPLNKGYTGIEEERDWIVSEVSGYYPSFFAYWKRVEKYLTKNRY